jgi:CheY-like chemotaxis protein
MQKKLLIVEDDKDIRFLYSAKLRTSGYAVTEAENGLEGLEVCRELLPDLVLVDLSMPVMNGLELIKELRQDTKFAKLRIVVLTNLSKTEAPHELRYLNIETYILKVHTTPTQLAQLVNGILKS